MKLTNILLILISKLVMIITLINFRCYKQQVFKFVEGQIIRLAGKTGAGKSTIMEAIYWGLYGKLRDVQNDSLDHKTVCSVKIELDKPKVTIYRQSNPGLLHVTVQDKPQVVGDIAQNYIDNLFGVNNLWLTSCYIQQKSRCAFLNSSNKDKTNLLNLLSFQQQDSRAIIDRIQNEFKQAKQNLQEQQIACNTETEIFNREQSNKPFNVENAKYSLEQLETWDKYLQDLTQQLQQLELQNEQEHHKTGKLNSLNQQLTEKQHQLHQLQQLNLEVISNDELTTLQQKEQQIAKLEFLQPLNTELQQILTKLNVFNLSDNEINLNIEVEQIFAAKQQQKYHTEQYLPLYQQIQLLTGQLDSTLLNYSQDHNITLSDINHVVKQQQNYDKYLQLIDQQTILRNKWDKGDAEWLRLYAIQWNWDIYQQAQTHLQIHLEQYLPLKQQVDQLEANLATELQDKITIDVDNNSIYQAKEHERKLRYKQDIEDKIKLLKLPSVLPLNWTNSDQQQL